MLHMIAAVSITVSHHIVAVCLVAAHEAATKISKSDILQHAVAVDKSIVENAVKFMICITCHQLILYLPAYTPLYLITRLF